MNIKTTINLKISQYNTISNIASEFNVTKSFIVNTLARKAQKYDQHKNCFLQRVKYQKRLVGEETWHCTSVSFLPDVYEKCIDVRKLSKVSVSSFISFAFDIYLEQLIKELKKEIKSDNYSSNYILFHKKRGLSCQVTYLWEMEEQKKLKKLYKMHT